MFLRTKLLVGLLFVGCNSLAVSDRNCAGLLDLKGMVPEVSFNHLGLNQKLNLKIVDGFSALDQDSFDGYSHLYWSGYLLASAPTIKCFAWSNNLVVFLADVNGYVDQVRVFDIGITKKILTPKHVCMSVYQPTQLDLLADIEMVKLNQDQLPMAIIKAPYGREVLIVHTYNQFMYKTHLMRNFN